MFARICRQLCSEENARCPIKVPPSRDVFIARVWRHACFQGERQAAEGNALQCRGKKSAKFRVNADIWLLQPQT